MRSHSMMKQRLWELELTSRERVAVRILLVYYTMKNWCNITVITNIPASTLCYFIRAPAFTITYSSVLPLLVIPLILILYSYFFFPVSSFYFLTLLLIPISTYARTASRPVRQISMVTGKTVRYYATLREAALQMDIRVCDMVQCCMGNCKACGNFVWKYIDKYTDGEWVNWRKY